MTSKTSKGYLVLLNVLGLLAILFGRADIRPIYFTTYTYNREKNKKAMRLRSKIELNLIN